MGRKLCSALFDVKDIRRSPRSGARPHIGGKSLNFPDLADRVSDDIYTKRLSIARAATELPLGNRAEVTRWRRECRKMFGEIVHG